MMRDAAWRLRLTVARSRIQGAGYGLYVRCSACRWCPYRQPLPKDGTVDDLLCVFRERPCLTA
jgi:hypothetical protein